jgi:hypothetical protein
MNREQPPLEDEKVERGEQAAARKSVHRTSQGSIRLVSRRLPATDV